MGEPLHAVAPIVALQAVLSILISVLLHKIGFRRRMTFDARSRIKPSQAGAVAARASHRLAAKVNSMPDEGKSRLVMVERFLIVNRWFPTLNSVAVCASNLIQSSMLEGLVMAVHTLPRGVLKMVVGVAIVATGQQYGRPVSGKPVD